MHFDSNGLVVWKVNKYYRPHTHTNTHTHTDSFLSIFSTFLSYNWLRLDIQFDFFSSSSSIFFSLSFWTFQSIPFRLVQIGSVTFLFSAQLKKPLKVFMSRILFIISFFFYSTRYSFHKNWIQIVYLSINLDCFLRFAIAIRSIQLIYFDVVKVQEMVFQPGKKIHQKNKFFFWFLKWHSKLNSIIGLHIPRWS